MILIVKLACHNKANVEVRIRKKQNIDSELKIIFTDAH